MNTPSQLHWACRRGMLELDVLLGNYLTEVYPNLPPHEQALFANLLSCQDQELYEWLTGKKLAPLKWSILIDKIMAHAKHRHHSATLETLA